MATCKESLRRNFPENVGTKEWWEWVHWRCEVNCHWGIQASRAGMLLLAAWLALQRADNL